MYKLFDIVYIKNIDRVKFVSGPPNSPASPQGRWVVVGSVDKELILAKDNTIIRIHPEDVVKIADYDANPLGEGNGKETKK